MACERKFGGAGKDLHYGDGIVVKDSRDVFRGELVCSIANEKTGFADGTVSNDDTSAMISMVPLQVDKEREETYFIVGLIALKVSSRSVICCVCRI